MQNFCYQDHIHMLTYISVRFHVYKNSFCFVFTSLPVLNIQPVYISICGVMIGLFSDL